MYFIWYPVLFFAGIVFGVVELIKYRKHPIIKIIQKIFNILEAMSSIVLLLIIITRGQFLLYIYGTGIDLLISFFLGTLLSASIGNSILI